MMVPEMAFANIDDGMNLAADFIKYVIWWALKNNLKDLEFSEQKFEKDPERYRIRFYKNYIYSGYFNIGKGYRWWKS